MRSVKGITLIELLIAGAIIAMLAGVGMPDLRGIFLKHNVDADARLILRHLQKTRESAVFSGHEMTFCGVDADQKCIRDNITRFVSFYDRNNNRRVDSDETVESEMQLAFPGQVHLRASNSRYIRYFNDGTANPFGSIWLCPSQDPTLIRRIANQMAGRPYLHRTPTGGETDGETITCGA